MSSQDRLENVLRDIHIMISRSEAFDADRIIVSKNLMFDLIDRLNASVYEIMDEYELTQQSRDRALRENRREGDKIIQNASHQAEDIYAASVLYTEEALNHLHSMVVEADDTIGRLYRRFQKDMKQQEDMIRENHLELKSQLQLLTDTNKYLRLIEERNREIERERNEKKGRKALEKDERHSKIKPEIKINEEYFRKAGIPLEKDEEEEQNIEENIVMEPLEDEGVIESTLRKADDTAEKERGNLPENRRFGEKRELSEGRKFGEKKELSEGRRFGEDRELTEGRRFGEDRELAEGRRFGEEKELSEGRRFGENRELSEGRRFGERNELPEGRRFEEKERAAEDSRISENEFYEELLEQNEKRKPDENGELLSQTAEKRNLADMSAEEVRELSDINAAKDRGLADIYTGEERKPAGISAAEERKLAGIYAAEDRKLPDSRAVQEMGLTDIQTAEEIRELSGRETESSAYFGSEGYEFSDDRVLPQDKPVSETPVIDEDLVKVNLDAEYFKWKQEEETKSPQREKLSLLDKLMGKKKSL